MCAAFVCILYVMMLCGSQGKPTHIFGGATVTVHPHGLILEQKFQFGWLGLYSKIDGKESNRAPFDDGHASWRDYKEKEWRLPFDKCSKACPTSGFFALVGLLLAVFEFGCGCKRMRNENKNTCKSCCWLLISALCTACGVLVVLVFWLGCYKTLEEEDVGLKAGQMLGITFEKKLRGGFIAAILATFLSMFMTVFELLYCMCANRAKQEKEDTQPL